MRALACLLVLAACDDKVPSVLSPAPAPKPTPSTEAHGDALREILTPEQSTEFARYGSPASYFTPSTSEIADFEARLPKELQSKRTIHEPSAPPLALRAPKYFRQYVSYVDKNGVRWIWGNFFCPTSPAVAMGHWRGRVLFVSDGGDCYFSVEFNPDTHVFRNFGANGDA